jgi:para-nitrobenzyl esterase
MAPQDHPTAAGSADDTLVVTTDLGAIRGTVRDGIARFAGIRYAAPPVGDLRFRPPAPPEPWQGEYDATRFGHVSPQNPSLMDALFGGDAEVWDEDCLFLNVWTPEPAARGTDGGLPVMVWIHGGGFEMGSGSSPLYRGESFARDGVVLVTLNYRLGSLGFLDLTSLDASEAGSGNVGLLDQVVALRWVRDHIAAFGGDPGRVTVFGESAGAMSTSLLLSVPEARGLLHGAISQSGSITTARSPELAAADAGQFLAAAGIEAAGAEAVAALRAAPVQQLLAAHASMASARMADPESVIRSHGNPLAFLAFRPVADGVVVPDDPIGAVAAGSAAGVPLLIGTNREEWKLFALMATPTTDEESLRRRLGLIVADVDAALDAYRRAHPEATVAGIEEAFLTDVVFRIPAVQLADAQAEHAPVWQYRFDWASPAWGGAIGAAHAVEIPFVFDLVADHRLHVFVGPEAPAELADRMHAAWVAFARDGVPSADGLPEWVPVPAGSAARADSRPVMLLDVEPRLADDPDGVTRAFWAQARSVLD